MRRTRLLGLLLICTLTTAMPVQAAAQVPAPAMAVETADAETPAPLADEAEAAESPAPLADEAETEAVSVEDAAETEAVSGADTSSDDHEAAAEEAAAQEETAGQADTAGQTQGADPLNSEDPAQEDGAAAEAGLADTTEEAGLAGTTEEAAPDGTDKEAALADTTEEAGLAGTAEEAAPEGAAAVVDGESAEHTSPAQLAAAITEKTTRDLIHFITLNGATGASDAVLIESDGKYGLIDSSNPSAASSDPDFAFTKEYADAKANGLTVVKYLTDLNVSHLEFVMATHSHSDHIGGMPDIANSGMVNESTVYIYKEYADMPSQAEFHNDYYYNAALDSMRAKNATLLNVLDLFSNFDSTQASRKALGAELKKDSEDNVGDHLKFSLGNFLISLFNLHTASVNDENLNSIVTTVKKGDQSAVMMADMEMGENMESRSIDAIIRNEEIFKADVYKAGHHGYCSSTSKDTITALKPSNFVISTNSTSSMPTDGTVFNYFIENGGGKLYRTSENGPALIAEFGDQGVTMLRSSTGGSTASAIPWRAVIKDGWHNWYPNEESRNVSGFKWIYFRSGAPLKGWFQVGSNWYMADDNYIMQTGWIQYKNNWYLLGSGGAMQKGWASSEGNWYYLGTDGIMRTGWVQDGGKWYYMDSEGAMQRGMQVIGDKTYYFGAGGAMQKGWVKDNGKYYYFGSNGAMQKGWLSLGGKWYYLGGNGDMQIGWIIIGGRHYYFASNGAMQKGWISSGGYWYYLGSGGAMLADSWLKDNGSWYYFGKNGAMQRGWKTISGKRYFFAAGGAMQTGWLKDGDKWYFLESSGVMQTGWVKDAGKWYYMDSDGAMVSGWRNIGGKNYFFAAGGVMQTGWLKDAGKWYYLDSDGARAQDKWVGDYYMKANGEMAISEWIGNYYVGADGKWIRDYKPAA